jgi:hypothetical protein
VPNFRVILREDEWRQHGGLGSGAWYCSALSLPKVAVKEVYANGRSESLRSYPVDYDHREIRYDNATAPRPHEIVVDLYLPESSLISRRTATTLCALMGTVAAMIAALAQYLSATRPAEKRGEILQEENTKIQTVASAASDQVEALKAEGSKMLAEKLTLENRLKKLQHPIQLELSKNVVHKDERFTATGRVTGPRKEATYWLFDCRDEKKEQCWPREGSLTLGPDGEFEKLIWDSGESGMLSVCMVETEATAHAGLLKWFNEGAVGGHYPPMAIGRKTMKVLACRPFQLLKA